ncbi:MAG: ABC transporter permease [Holosporales bacterium]|jgi:ABC-2 type transport system permease protein|nr:ABC transporter permease [Holosporales bacterium]
MVLTGVGALTRKELLNLLREPKSAFMIFFPIVLFLTLFVLATTKDVENTSVVILNHDNGAHSLNLLDKIVNTKIFEESIYVNSEKDFKSAINNEDAFIGIMIPQHFSKNMSLNRKADIQVITDGRRTNAAMIVLGYLSQILGGYQRSLLGAAAKNWPEVSVRTWYNTNKNQRWFSVTNLICMIIINQAIILTALSIAREKEEGTFDQLLVSPIKPLGMLVGKTLPSIIISMFMGGCTMVLGHLIYDVPINGSLLLMLIAMTVYVVSVIGIGVCVASFASTQQQAMLGTFVIQMPVASLSGLMTPVESVTNPIMKAFVVCNPMVYGNKLVKGIMLKNMSISDAFENILPMIIIGAVATMVAVLSFSHRHRIKIF